ncbi:hypothetical protein BDW02DRAFT_603615 [Decorospora gaudefroyi]|uniref:Cyanovirin-N domain-containing protein n=1 Tax=Decorospora gaudefroyi TaxID=184978 RepID=A0A6A5K1D3_9PLEO|nr:hypothetical protein BDW02DRAFT_603615 [Decorospora gaudefroyi]
MYLPTLAAGLTLLVGLVKADFSVYITQDATPFLSPLDRLMFFDGPPSCDDVCGHGNSHALLDDVSYRGARCSGPGCGPPGYSGDIWELEVHVRDVTHWTIYQDDNYDMRPADNGPDMGSCVRDTSDSFVCACGVARDMGRRAFYCNSWVTADFLRQ